MFFRFLLMIFYIFLIIISSFLGISTRHYRRISIFDNYDNRDELASSIAKRTRRFMASRRSKKYLTHKHNCYRLSNQNVVVLYDPTNKIIFCRDKRNKSISSTYNYINQKEYSYDILHELFDETFDTILASFGSRSDYEGTTTFLNQYFSATAKKGFHTSIEDKNKVNKQKPKTKKMQTVNEYFKNTKTTVTKLNINTASESELATLPGISIIIAKRIIKYRQVHDGFESLEELYKEINIKPHFQKQLNKLICLQNEEKEAQKTTKSENDERIIDI